MRLRSGLVAGVALLGAVALYAQQVAAPETTGYAAKDGLVDAARYLPPPPVPGSDADRSDRAAVAAGRAQARADAKLAAAAVAELHMRSPEARVRMLCAVDARLTPENAPTFYRLMLRTGRDLSAASSASKDAWKRPRPFVGAATPDTCYPADDADWKSGLGWAYPSGHAGIGWLWGMILSEVAPDRAADALKWGANVGDHRIACGVHYPSDIAAGRMLGSAVFARIAANPEFRADLDAAKAEVAAIRAKGERPAGCPA